MNKFNLTFRGEILDGHDPAQVQTRVAEALEIKNPDLLQKYFSGKTVVLRQNLERKEAAELYARLRRLGIHTELVKVGELGARQGGNRMSAAALAIATARPQGQAPVSAATKPRTAAAKPGSGPGQDEEQQSNRRADLAANKTLRPDEAALLKSKEKALKRALRARAREEAKRARERERAQKEEAKQEEQKRLAAARAASDMEKAKAEQIAATLRIEAARRKREQAEEAARRKAEEERKKAEERERLRAAEEEQLAQRRAMEEQAISRAAEELALNPSLKPVEARVKTRMETPSRQRRADGGAAPGRRRRQPGAPNLYSLLPFRNTPDIRARAGKSRRMMRRAFSAAAIAGALAAIVAVGLLALPPSTPTAGAIAIAIDPTGGPLLLADDRLLLHDRAGVGDQVLTAESLGLEAMTAPMLFNKAGELLLVAAADTVREPTTRATASQLMRCVLAESACEPYSGELADTEISALIVHPLDDSLFIADSRAGELLKVSPTGAVLARAAVDLPTQPALRLDSGLLLVNGVSGPDINVLRYEDDAFGEQLEELTLLPLTAEAPEFSSVRDFLWNEGHWWVLLDQAHGNGTRLYRFDSQWQPIDEIALVPGSHPTQLVTWGKRVLLVDSTRLPVQRFNSAAQTETALLSGILSDLAGARERRTHFILLAWRIVLALCVLSTVAGLCLGWLHRARSLVYTSCRETGAEPVEKIVDDIEWLEVVPDRAARLNRRAIAYAVLAAATVLVSIGLGVSVLQLSAVLLALAGPAIVLILLQRSDPGHIGVLGEQLLLVDHQGVYHLGGGSRVHYHGPFLMIDDVTVFTGTRLLPAFAPAAIAAQVTPIALGGVKVDRTIVTVKLLQGRHPLAVGAVAIATTLAAAIALLSLQGVF